MMIPPVAWSVRAQGRARWRLLLRPRPGSGEDAIPPEVEVEAGPWGRARRRPPSEVEAEPWGRARQSPPSEAEAGAEPWVGRGGERLLRPRRGPSPWVGRGGDLQLHLRRDLAVVSLTLAGGRAVGAGQAALFSCQVSQWRGKVTTVTSALPTEERASG
jgi:hypothetical protein